MEISVANRALQLFLAPPAVLKKQGFVFDKGAVTEVIGMPGFKVNGLPALQTRRLTSGKRTLRLRDESGRPVWN